MRPSEREPLTNPWAAPAEDDSWAPPSETDEAGDRDASPDGGSDSWAPPPG